MTTAPLSRRESIVLALEGQSGPGRTRMNVGRPESRQALVTNWPMNPADPTIRVRPVLAPPAHIPVMFTRAREHERE